MRRVIVAALAVVGMLVTTPLAAQAEGATGDAVVRAFGSAGFKGSTGDMALTRPLVALAATPTGQGYWLVAGDGGIFNYGDAVFYGSTGDLRLNKAIVGIASTPTGRGYWLVAGDGGIFSFGDAAFYGSTGDLNLNQPIVGLATTPTGRGYRLVAGDGGIFSFGDADFYGSTGDLNLVRPIAGLAATPTGRGYRLVAADGGIFSFGDADFYGTPAEGGRDVGAAAVASTPSGRGYWVAGRDGSVYAYGDASAPGSFVGQLAPGRAVVGMAAAPTGNGYWLLASTVPPSVTSIQEQLNALGYWVPVTGQLGTLTTQAVYALQKVNGLPRTGQVGPAEEAALASGERAVPRSTSGYVIEVDKTRQVIIVARDGRAELVFNTSTGTGRPYPGGIAITPEGRFTIQRQIDGLRISALGQLFRPKYFTGGYAVHGSPSIPPYPASHGCVRVSNAAINFIWANGIMPIGTPLWSYS